MTQTKQQQDRELEALRDELASGLQRCHHLVEEYRTKIDPLSLHDAEHDEQVTNAPLE